MRPSRGVVSNWTLKPLPSAWSHALPMRVQNPSLPSRLRTWQAMWLGVLEVVYFFVSVI
jgi:hypothetical protein